MDDSAAYRFTRALIALEQAARKATEGCSLDTLECYPPQIEELRLAIAELDAARAACKLTGQ